MDCSDPGWLVSMLMIHRLVFQAMNTLILGRGKMGDPQSWGTAVHNPDLLPGAIHALLFVLLPASGSYSVNLAPPGAKMWIGNRRKPTAPPDVLICKTCPHTMTMRQMADSNLEARPWRTVRVRQRAPRAFRATAAALTALPLLAKTMSRMPLLTVRRRVA